MSVHDIDYLIDDFEAYAKKFTEITGRHLTKEEWQETRAYLSSRQQIKPPIVEWSTFKSLSDAFDEEHPYLISHVHVPMLVRAIWAEHVGLISTAELDEINRKWRTAR